MSTEIAVAEKGRKGLTAIPQELLDRAREYARASKAESTIKTYASVWRLFTDWCESHGQVALPATPETAQSDAHAYRSAEDLYGWNGHLAMNNRP